LKSNKRTPVSKLTAKVVRKNAMKEFNAISNEVTMRKTNVASFDKELAKAPNGTVIEHAYRMDLSRKRAVVQKKLNSAVEKLNTIEKRIIAYNQNDEAVLKERGLYWGA